ncbi:MAG: dihydrofolate reductase, partial [Proteobacteria bacterium]|nr:dihydrofolate reductase [Pseudomonadota bacterium]
MSYTLIAAMDQNRLIGKNNTLPWHISADLKLFKQNTVGKNILMGRNTCESIGKPLPNRKNYVLTHNKTYHKSGFIIINKLEQLAKDQEIMVIGGATIYQQLLPVSDKMILTRIHAEFDGDTYFPEFDLSKWVIMEKSHYPVNKTNPEYPFDLIY